MNKKVVQVEQIPMNVEKESTLEIVSNNVAYFTHGFFKYPCKFIPHIPKWAINKYTGKNAIVLDPFAGSGTSLVEAVLAGRRAIGVDFDKLSQLLCKTKTQTLRKEQIAVIDRFSGNVMNSKKGGSEFLPDLHNIYHWFPGQTVEDLQHLRRNIEKLYAKTKDEVVHDFLLVVFASIIRKCSYADDTSPKPYVSSRIKKSPLSVEEAFEKTITSYLNNLKSFRVKALGKSEIIGDDARDICAPRYFDKVSLAVTSPPYINAFDYVRSLRLENAWLGFYGDSNIISMKRKQIGTETISSKQYTRKISGIKSQKLRNLINKISKTDQKRAYVVYQFFKDMEKNIQQVHMLLKEAGHYVIVVGNSTIRGVPIPTRKLLVEIAEMNGFELENVFSYIIKNRYLRIPRGGKGGLIKYDWVIDLVKRNG